MLSSQRQDDVTESQPFFKPSNQSQNQQMNLGLPERHSSFMFGDREMARNTATSIFQVDPIPSTYNYTSKNGPELRIIKVLEQLLN